MNSWPLVQQTVAHFFKIDPKAIHLQTSANDISDWDSFSHMELITAIENNLQVNIPFDVLMEFNTLEDLVTFLDHQT